VKIGVVRRRVVESREDIASKSGDKRENEVHSGFGKVADDVKLVGEAVGE
jgi:hypothetical protein